MFRVLNNQHDQHRTNQKLRSWANAVFQNRGVCGQEFSSFRSPSPVIPFGFCSRLCNFLHELARKCLLRRLAVAGYVCMYKYTNIQVPRFQRNYIIASDLHGTSFQSSPKINRMLNIIKVVYNTRPSQFCQLRFLLFSTTQ